MFFINPYWPLAVSAFHEEAGRGPCGLPFSTFTLIAPPAWGASRGAVIV